MKQKQYTSTILMVEPTAFYYNPETAVNNYFQTETTDSQEDIQQEALAEFQGMVSALRSKGVNVITIKDTASPHTPDSIFPNNWISFHDNGNVVLYPMFAKNRREERREEDVLGLLEEKGFYVEDVIDFSSAEEDEIFLEGTGSIILDRENELAYACVSQRTDEDLLIEFCEELEYTPVIFHANQTVKGERKPIYHTNVMMCLGENFAVICSDCIDDKKERKMVLDNLKENNKEIILITEAQVNSFAGNMLEVRGANDKKYLVMSAVAHQCLTLTQIEQLEKHAEILSSSLDTIEACGGGSARCMMAEVFLPRN